MTPLDPELPVIVPGDRGRGREEAVRERGGVIYKAEQVKTMMELAEELSVTPPVVKEI